MTASLEVCGQSVEHMTGNVARRSRDHHQVGVGWNLGLGGQEQLADRIALAFQGLLERREARGRLRIVRITLAFAVKEIDDFPGPLGNLDNRVGEVLLTKFGYVGAVGSIVPILHPRGAHRGDLVALGQLRMLIRVDHLITHLGRRVSVRLVQVLGPLILATLEEPVKLKRSVEVSDRAYRLGGEAENLLLGGIEAMIVPVSEVVDGDHQGDEHQRIENRVGAVPGGAAAKRGAKRFAAGSSRPQHQRKDPGGQVDKYEKAKAGSDEVVDYSENQQDQSDDSGQRRTLSHLDPL